MSGFMNDQKLPVKAILIGAGIAVAVTMLTMCIICAAMTFTSAVPYHLLPYIMLIADAVGVFAGSYISAAINKSRGLIIGLIIGFLLFILLFVIGLSTGETIGIMTPLRFTVLMVFGAFGGIRGVNKKEKLHIK